MIEGLNNENSRAAAAYLLASQVAAVLKPGEHMTQAPPASWPFAPELFKPDLSNPINCLVTARGFINREIERLQREAAAKFACAACGWEYPADRGHIVPTHDSPKPCRSVCPGSKRDGIAIAPQE